MPKSCAWSFTALLLPLLLASPVLAQVGAQIEELNAQALEAYQNLDIDTAGSKLEEALGIAQQNNYTGPEVAATYMNLGVIYVTGVGDPDQALSNFVSALCIQNDVQLDPLLSTPDVQMVFEQAVAEAQGGACGGGAAAPPQQQPSYQELMPQQVPASAGPRMIDEECPPGIVCGGEGGGGDAGPTDWARFFFGVGVSLGNTLVQSGMEADSRPPLSEVIDGNGLDLAGGPPDPFTGDPTPDGLPDWADDDFDGMVGYGDLPVVDPVADPTLAALYAPYTVQIDTDGDGTPDLTTVDFDRDGLPDNRYFFDDKSAWVPDADSFDDFQQFDSTTGAELIPRAVTPVSKKCEEDGTATGPLNLNPPGVAPTFTTMEPSKYCVRVEKVGFVQNIALRLNPGYFIASSFALSLPVRIQFDAGEGTLSNMLIGLRGEILFSEPDEATGFPFSFFFGATVGQIQAKPPPADPNRPAPYVISGPLGGHVGFNWRLRFDRNFGLFIAPEVDVQFPSFLLNVDATAGAEVAF